EVYLPDLGWVSFEPTPGFSQNPIHLADSLNGHDARTVSAGVSQSSFTDGGGAGLDSESDSWISRFMASSKQRLNYLSSTAPKWGHSVNAAVAAGWNKLQNQSIWFGLMVLLLLFVPIKKGYRQLFVMSKNPIGGIHTTGRDRAMKSFDSIWTKLGRRLGARRPEQTIQIGRAH